MTGASLRCDTAIQTPSYAEWDQDEDTPRGRSPLDPDLLNRLKLLGLTDEQIDNHIHRRTTEVVAAQSSPESEHVSAASAVQSHWQAHTPIGDPSEGVHAAGRDEAKHAFDAMMGMKKIDVAAIKAARQRG